MSRNVFATVSAGAVLLAGLAVVSAQERDIRLLPAKRLAPAALLQQEQEGAGISRNVAGPASIRPEEGRASRASSAAQAAGVPAPAPVQSIADPGSALRAARGPAGPAVAAPRPIEVNQRGLRSSDAVSGIKPPTPAISKKK